MTENNPPPSGQNKPSFLAALVAWYRSLSHSGILLFYCLAQVAFGLGAILWQRPAEKGTAFLWSGAWFWTGFLFGFIFAFPKPSARMTSATIRVPSDSDKTEDRGSDVNSNLLDVSDWLTKSIVGIGLVELKQLPDWGKRLATFMAAGWPSVTNGVSLAGAIIVYFGTIGFIYGYHFTRIYTAPIFRDVDGRQADRRPVALTQ